MDQGHEQVGDNDVSRSEGRFGAPGKSYERLPALEIEGAVVAQIRTALTSPESIASMVCQIQRNGGQVDEDTPEREARSAEQDSALMRAIGLAHHWQRLLDEQRAASAGG